MGEVDDDELRIPNLNAHDVVDEPRSRAIVHIDEFITSFFFHHRFQDFLNESVEFGFVKLHSQKTIVPFEPPAFFGLVLLPSVESQIDINKRLGVANKLSFIRYLDDAALG